MAQQSELDALIAANPEAASSIGQESPKFLGYVQDVYGTGVVKRILTQFDPSLSASQNLQVATSTPDPIGIFTAAKSLGLEVVHPHFAARSALYPASTYLVVCNGSFSNKTIRGRKVSAMPAVFDDGYSFGVGYETNKRVFNNDGFRTSRGHVQCYFFPDDTEPFATRRNIIRALRALHLASCVDGIGDGIGHNDYYLQPAWEAADPSRDHVNNPVYFGGTPTLSQDTLLRLSLENIAHQKTDSAMLNIIDHNALVAEFNTVKSLAHLGIADFKDEEQRYANLRNGIPMRRDAVHRMVNHTSLGDLFLDMFYMFLSPEQVKGFALHDEHRLEGYALFGDTQVQDGTPLRLYITLSMPSHVRKGYHGWTLQLGADTGKEIKEPSIALFQKSHGATLIHQAASEEEYGWFTLNTKVPNEKLKELFKAFYGYCDRSYSSMLDSITPLGGNAC